MPSVRLHALQRLVLQDLSIICIVISVTFTPWRRLVPCMCHAIMTDCGPAPASMQTLFLRILCSMSAQSLHGA